MNETHSSILFKLENKGKHSEVACLQCRWLSPRQDVTFNNQIYLVTSVLEQLLDFSWHTVFFRF